MNDDRINSRFQLIKQQIAALRKEKSENWQEVDAALEELLVIYEEMQTTLDAAETIGETLLQQNQQIAADYYHYHNLFHASPIAYLVTDASGIILDANQAVAQLFNLPHRYLAGKPLVSYVASGNRAMFRTRLSQISKKSGVQIWQMEIFPRGGQPFATEWHVAVARRSDGQVESLRIGLYDLSRLQQTRDRLAGQNSLDTPAARERSISRLPQALDGLRVLVVDDEADVREFITAVLESHGIGVRTVSSTVAALEELERFRPDVLLSDIRMPDGDGYSLIQQVRAWETERGGHIPAVAITAYLDEDREKVLNAGFEAYLQKLAQPTDWIETIAQLAGQCTNSDRNSLN